ncbi:E3 ubiquitin-protein ligase RNF115-like [Daphnia pulicaria]|uniref:E3 ubiquitin-protein ligase RNF115-like n=1 Tax=Daphnia pulicaria TaxID=35523 RepID=UPI001EEBAD92|nr:E3 ubiquitin-protein ligase RNF115-like [Daphnia pulicaria]
MAAVSEPNSSNRFFCHRCNVEIARVLPGFKCPRCNSGFIEEMELPTQQSFSDESSDEGDAEMVTSIGELLSQSLFGSLRDATVPQAANNGEREDEEPSSTSSGAGNGTATRRRRQPVTFNLPVRSTRRRTNSDRQMAPLETIIQEFIINLSGFDFDPAVLQAQGSPMFMYGNPGDYAFGRAGLDAIITQLLNQMDGTGPPPMAKDKISQIPTVAIDQQQVEQNLQCSVCWEDFKLAEPVRKLVCEHYYHTQCIVPWLQLHGTCPICRKALNDDSVDAESESASAAGPSTSSSSSSSANSSSGISWLNSTRDGQTGGPRSVISSLIGSITNALSGGSSSSTSSASPSYQSSSPSFASSSQQQPGRENSSNPFSSFAPSHSYNLRSSRERPGGQESTEEDEDSSNGASAQQRPTQRFAGRGRGRSHHFEDDYD